MEERHKGNLALGLLAILGVWLTAGIALPFVNVLKPHLSPEQILLIRGGMTAFIALLLLRGWGALGVDRYTVLIAVILAFASLGLYRGVREWGAGPTIIVVAATPIINFLFAWKRREKVSLVPLASLIVLLQGIALAVGTKLEGGGNALSGFLWSVFGTIANGVLYELFAKTKSGHLEKCFWGSLGIAAIGFFGSLGEKWPVWADEPYLAAWVIILFGLVGGFLYWLSNVVAFREISTPVASVLLQGEAVTVILGAWIMLGESLRLIEWVGVATALIGAASLSYWLSRQSE